MYVHYIKIILLACRGEPPLANHVHVQLIRALNFPPPRPESHAANRRASSLSQSARWFNKGGIEYRYVKKVEG